MPARHAAGPRRTSRALGTSVLAAAGVLSLVAGTLVLTHEPAVVAESFGAPATAGTVEAEPTRASPRPSGAPPLLEPSVTGPDVAPGRAGTNTTSTSSAPVPPGRVSFSGAGVVAEVTPVGVLASGALQIPEDPSRIGWWAAGAMPGQSEGSLVLAGHMDGLNHGGTMSVLLDIEAGDPVAVQDRRGSTHRYRVISRDTQPRQSIDLGLFTIDGSHRLVLITCGGTYDQQTGQYTDNIVVIAEPVTAQ